MVKLLTREEGEKAVRLAREAIEHYLEERKIIQKRLGGVSQRKEESSQL